ncbi:hypothetical protein G7046_g83 [Stylonectria norvegica]|nr:hypothetical protein G7046_g83 [Stylonectria norvegica]
MPPKANLQRTSAKTNSMISPDDPARELRSLLTQCLIVMKQLFKIKVPPNTPHLPHQSERHLLGDMMHDWKFEMQRMLDLEGTVELITKHPMGHLSLLIALEDLLKKVEDLTGLTKDCCMGDYSRFEGQDPGETLDQAR